MTQTEFCLPSGKTVNTRQCYWTVHRCCTIHVICVTDLQDIHIEFARFKLRRKSHSFNYPELETHGNHAPKFAFSTTINNCYFTLKIKTHCSRNVRPLLTTFQNKSEEKKSLVTLSIKTTYFRW